MCILYLIFFLEYYSKKYILDERLMKDFEIFYGYLL